MRGREVAFGLTIGPAERALIDIKHDGAVIMDCTLLGGLLARVAQYVRDHPCDVCDGTRGDCDELADRILAEFGEAAAVTLAANQR